MSLAFNTEDWIIYGDSDRFRLNTNSLRNNNNQFRRGVYAKPKKKIEKAPHSASMKNDEKRKNKKDGGGGRRGALFLHLSNKVDDELCCINKF